MQPRDVEVGEIGAVGFVDVVVAVEEGVREEIFIGRKSVPGGGSEGRGRM